MTWLSDTVLTGETGARWRAGVARNVNKMTHVLRQWLHYTIRVRAIPLSFDVEPLSNQSKIVVVTTA